MPRITQNAEAIEMTYRGVSTKKLFTPNMVYFKARDNPGITIIPMLPLLLQHLQVTARMHIVSKSLPLIVSHGIALHCTA